MANRKRSLFQRTEDSANAKQNAHMQGGGNGIIGLQQAGARRQARSNSEALGMGFREFILPMIIQGAMDWKANYNARGDFKATGAELLDRLIAGDQLSAQEQAILDNYKKRYGKEYADALAAAQARALAAAQARAQQPAPQGTQPTAPNQPSQIAQELANAANLPNPDWAGQFAERPTDAAVGAPFSGVDYDAKWAQDSQQILNDLQGGAQDDYLSKLLKATRGGW